MIKAIVMDMDGTLLNEHNQISEETAAYLKELEKRGVALILASGRSYTRLLPYARRLNMDKYGGWLIEIDGVAFYETKTNTREKLRMMEPDEIRPVFEWLMHQDAESQAMFDDGAFVWYPKSHQAIKEAIRKEQNLPEDYPWTAGPWSYLNDFRDGYPYITYIQSADEISRPINKLQIMNEEEKLIPVYEALQKEFGSDFSIYRTTPRQLEVLPKGFSKGKGVEHLMEQNGWKPDEVVVFGDGENDVSMFDVVRDSFAMGNARDYVKRKAAHVTASNRENGIVKGLVSLGLPKPEDLRGRDLN